ncbi:MAG: sulfatase-like hydrolase/transferase, partial [Candidatus Aminicenantes bacterium]
ANWSILYYIDSMKKKVSRILVSLFLVVMLFLVYQFFNYRKACQWELQKDQAPQIEKRKKKNHLHQVLFLNEIYQNYDSFSPKDDIPLNKFSADLSSLSIIKGEKRKEHKDLLITGDEVVIAVWNLARLMETNHLDLMEIELLSTRNITMDALVITKTSGIFGGIPRGNLLHRTRLAANKKRQFETVAMDLPKKLGAGILIKITPQGKKKKVRIKIRNLSLLSRKFKIIEDMPRLDYFKYGGFDRRRLKSVFLRPGSTLTYSIAATSPAHQKIFLDGYLGSVDEKPLTFKILVNEKPVVFEKVSKGISYFKSEVESRQDRLKLTIHVSGESSGIGVLGNVSFYRNFKEKKNVVVYLVDGLRADKCGIKEKVFENSFKHGAIFTGAYANAARTADSLPALFTGKYKFTLVKKKHEVPFVRENEFLLAEYFKCKGYVTAAFINNPWLLQSNSSQGFDFVNSCWKHVKQAKAFPGEEDYINAKYGEMEKYLQEFVRQNKSRPVFVYIHTMEPHVPYEPPKKMRRYSANADPGILKTLFKKVTQSPTYPKLTHPNAGQLEVLKSLYKDQVVIAYDFFKKVHAYLEVEGIINSWSLFILTSDHGERFYEHGSWIHGPPDVYNEVLRIPLMIKGPGIKPGIYTKNVQLLDIYPTIMDWFNDKPRKNLVGNSLLNYINSNKPGDEFNERVIYIDGTGNPHQYQYAYIKNKIKVIIDGNKAEVYDLEKDPGETADIGKDLRFKELIAEAKVFGQKFKTSFDKERKKRKMSQQERERLKTLGYIE